MNKFKVGDRVVIKKNIETIISLTPESVLIMKKHEGKEVTIVQTDVNAFLGKPMYKLDIDNGMFVWDESVLLPALLDIGDKVRIANVFPEISGKIETCLTLSDTDSSYLVELDKSGRYVSLSGKTLQKILNPQSLKNDKHNETNKEEEIMISDYRVEECTIYDKTSGIGQHIKGKRTILEWTDGTVTTVKCPESELNAYNGFAIALAKKAMGNDNTMNKLADYWINKLPAKSAKMQAEIEKHKTEELRIAEKKKAKKEKWEMRKAVLARKRAYEDARKQRTIAEIAEREFGVPIDFKAE